MGNCIFLFFHGLNFFIKLPMAKPTFEVFPSCDNAYLTLGPNGITICLIIFMHIDSLIYWHAKTTTRQPLAPLHSKCIQHVLNFGKDILELVDTLGGELCGVWWLRMVYKEVNACNWEFTVMILSQMTRDHVLSHFQADLESQIMYDMTAIAYHVILNIKAVGLILCVYLIRIRLANGLMPQYVHGNNNVLSPSLSDSNWLEGLGAEIAPASGRRPRHIDVRNAIIQRYFTNPLTLKVWKITLFCVDIERPMLHFHSLRYLVYTADLFSKITMN